MASSSVALHGMAALTSPSRVPKVCCSSKAASSSYGASLNVAKRSCMQKKSLFCGQTIVPLKNSASGGHSCSLSCTRKSSVFKAPQATVLEKEATDVEAEKFEYQAEVSRLLDLIVNSLYSNKEVFLRELVSNASDALDKLRFLSLTDPSLLGEVSDLEIRIKADPDQGTITIMDTGIGMTKDELIDSLGTIAQSGTAKFLKAVKENKEGGGGDNNLIGQFGVGFYSAFLVAEKVIVSTKSSKVDKQFVWEGKAETSSYTITEENDPENLIPRGTSITLVLKPDDKFEYTDPIRIQNLVKNYSQFISFPIYVWQEKTRTVEVEDESEESKPEEGTEVESTEKKTKTETEKYFDWELVNETQPIWMRNTKEVLKEEYDAFYKTTFNEFLEPLAYTHFTTEGEVEFKSLLYVPGMAPFNADEMVNPKSNSIRLYVKRVFISDEFDGELFPRYLAFVKGVIDSNDLPLNVSREILQESRIVRIMRKRLVRKALDMFEEIAQREDKEKYKTFWTNFGKNIKLGCIEDSANHKRLAPLLRFFSSKHEDEMISLNDYVEKMEPDQKAIYYLAADSVKSAKSAPFLEELAKRGLEVLFLVEPIDEVAISNLQTFQDKKFVDISKEDLDLGEEDETKEKEMEKEYRLLCDWMKQLLVNKVAKVQISKRISSSPCVLVSGKFGWSANMERIMKAQTLGDTSQMEFMKGRRILEINPNHPIIKDLNVACKDTPRNEKAHKLVELLYETALLSSGYTPDNPAEFGVKIYEMMALASGQDWDSEENGPVTTTEPEVSPAEAEVVEPSEIRVEGDPWRN